MEVAERSVVQTATGPVDASSLGVVLSHEHTFGMGGGLWHAYPQLFDWDETERRVLQEFRAARAGGIGTMIDLSTPDLGRNVAFVRRISEQTGVNIVVATGLWRDIPRFFWDQTPERIARIFIDEIRFGMEGTTILPGVIKVANDAEGVSPQAELVLRAAAIASRETGTPISTHHWAPLKVGLRQSEVLLEAGAPPHLVCIGHSADTTDIEYLESLLRLGVYLSMDRYPGAEGRPDWRARNATVVELVRRGWTGRIMLGHDYGVRLIERGATPSPPAVPTRYLFIQNTALPAMREQGVTDEQIRLMTTEVPRRFLTGATPLARD
jgi:phosphotriesterase-related protein